MKHSIALLALLSMRAMADPVSGPILNCINDVCPPGVTLVRPTASAPDRPWHVLVVTQGGTVSLIKDLTKEEAEHMAAKLRGLPYTPEEIATAKKAAAKEAADLAKCKADEKKQVPTGLQFTCGGNTMTWVQASDIRSVEVFQ
jgi:hypothetical protein